MQKPLGPKVLILDIETAPILGFVWSLWENNVALNQIHSDWFILSWAAKWLGDPPSKTLYMDQRDAKNIEDDSKILKKMWELLDEADIVLTQNGKSFDIKKLNARFILNGFQPPSSFKQIDTMLLAKKHFAFTSNKLEYMTGKLCTKYKKLVNRGEFAGFEMWKECLKGNLKAWQAMEKYNRYDVLSLEELYTKLIPWDNSVNFNLYHDDVAQVCTCGASDWRLRGYFYTSTGKYQRRRCNKCGSETRDRLNLLSPVKKKSIKMGTTR